MAKVAAPAVPRKRRRDNRERNGSILSTAVPTIDRQTYKNLVRPTVGTIKFQFRNINSILCKQVGRSSGAAKQTNSELYLLHSGFRELTTANT
jgi:hypothetical protein